MKKVHISPLKKCLKSVTVQGDKSISHRAIIIGSQAKGKTKITNFLEAEDTLNTVDLYRNFGIKITCQKNIYCIYGRGMNSFRQPAKTLYVGNSGTAIRLTAGVLAAQNFTSVITGDAQIIKRPMKRIIGPLTKMGAKFESNKGYPPITIHGSLMKGIEHKMEIASAQVKSAILLAALYAAKPTIVTEPEKSRDHTERMLSYFGADIKVTGRKIRLNPGKELRAKNVFIPGDISSAAYFIAAGLLLKNSRITVRRSGMNPTRTGIIDVLKRMGAKITVKNLSEKNREPVGDITAFSSALKGTVIKGDMIPRLIDEIPVIAVAAAAAKGKTVIRDARELRVKETDRISSMIKNFKRIGVKAEELPDGMIIYGNGGRPFKYADIDSFGDHRIAMAFSIAALASDNGLLIKDIECVNTSFPDFFKNIDRLRKK